MIKEALEYLVNLKQPEIITMDDLQYSKRDWSPIMPRSDAVLRTYTLSGFIMATKNTYNKNPILHVLDHKTVNLIEKGKDEWGRYNHLIQAQYSFDDNFNAGCWYDIEEFIISLRTKFVQDDNTAAILKIVGNISDTFIGNFEDDGVTQTVTVKKGIVKNESDNLPGLIELRQYRTFIEAEQPLSLYCLRIKKLNDALKIALFDAGGDRWKLNAVMNIKIWLEKALKEAELNIEVIA